MRLIDAIATGLPEIQGFTPAELLNLLAFLFAAAVLDLLYRFAHRTFSTLIHAFNRMLDTLIHTLKPNQPSTEPQNEPKATSKPNTHARRRQPKRGKRLR